MHVLSVLYDFRNSMTPSTLFGLSCSVLSLSLSHLLSPLKTRVCGCERGDGEGPLGPGAVQMAINVYQAEVVLIFRRH